MAKQYDATVKQLIEAYPADWLACAGLPAGESVRVVDSDVSAVSAATDKVIRVAAVGGAAAATAEYIAHLECQAGPDQSFDLRMLLYNALLRWLHRLPVRTVALLLSPKALTPATTGHLRDVTGPDEGLDFSYRLIRVWELPVDQVLAGGLGTLPLAPISAVDTSDLPGVIERMADRVAGTVARQDADLLWATTYLLGGLRRNPGLMQHLLQRVWNMEESATYQAIVERGITKGRRADLLLVGQERFGPPGPEVLSAIDRITDPQQLQVLLKRALRASDWEEVFAGEE